MKFRTLSAAALVAVIGVGTVGPVLANAAADSQDSTGKVTVEAGTLDPDGGVVDPEDPDGNPLPTDPTDPDSPITSNPDVGAKGIMAVTDMDFGTIAVGTTTASAAELTITDSVTGTALNRGILVSFGDVTGLQEGYSITGELTSQFTNGTTTLDGAEIAFTNGILETSGLGAITTTEATLTNTLSTDGGVQTFVNTADGSGKWTMEFGQSTDYTGTDGTAGTSANSVNLTIPAAVANSMTVGDYVATVTWTMGAFA